LIESLLRRVEREFGAPDEDEEGARKGKKVANVTLNISCAIVVQLFAFRVGDGALLI
jgi:hypothetical protein